jgi:tetratricopeptide (TPR) repeat protein
LSGIPGRKPLFCFGDRPGGQSIQYREGQDSQQLVNLSPETPSFHDHLGHALIRVGQIESGVQELRLVVSQEPENADAHYSLGDVLQQLLFHAEARKHLEKALELEPKMANAQVGMGNVLRAEGRPDLAAGRYTLALRLRQNVYPEEHFTLALTYLDRNKPEKAAEHFLVAAEQKPAWALVHSSLANLYANWGKGPEAIEQYRIALDLLPADAALFTELGLVFKALNRIDEAREQFHEAARIAPTFYKPHVELGNLAFEAGDGDEALTYYEKALQLEPDHAEPAARLARYLATCSNNSHRDGTRALALAERAADLTGRNSPSVLDTLATACAVVEDYVRATAVAHLAQQVARQQGNAKLANAIGEKLVLFALEKPYFAPTPQSGDSDSEN